MAQCANNSALPSRAGGQLRFAKADVAQGPTKGRVLDHIGFDVKDLTTALTDLLKSE